MIVAGRRGIAMTFLGLDTFTWIHTIISLIALASGIVVALGIAGSRTLGAWSAIFLITAVATSATGFGFPFDHFLPSHWLGVLSLIVLALAILARYVFHYAGAWRWLYVLGVVLAVYFDAFVAIVQAFGKIPSLNALAPTQSEPPFVVAQVVALAAFAIIACLGFLRFRPVA
jgi:hypothetical protein